jgi:hypothetical protein
MGMLLNTSRTNAYNGTNPALDNYNNNTAGGPILYNPIFHTIYNQGLSPPLFSLALERDISGPDGYLALGGLPPVPFVDNFTSTPILLTTFPGSPSAFAFYTINIDGFSLNGKSLPVVGGPDIQWIVDSGTTELWLPTPAFVAISEAYDPPAGGQYINQDGFPGYSVDCNATAPEFSIIIGGTNFRVNPLDMILQETSKEGETVCSIGFFDGGTDSVLYILGDTFQRNVVSVFDVGAAEMRFAPRGFYPSNDLVKI